MSTGEQGHVFLSYRREETRHLAGRLSDRLTSRFGAGTVFMDVDTVAPGADFTEAIAGAVASSDVLIAMIGPRWSSITDRHGRRRIDDIEDFVALEILTALKRGITVIPVLVDGADMPTYEELPESLRPLARRNAIRVDHETFTSDSNQLVGAIENTMEAHGRAPNAPPTAFPAGTGRRAVRADAGGEQQQTVIPFRRSVYRVLLWWCAFWFGPLLVSAVVASIRQSAADRTVNVIFALVLTALVAGVIFLLRWEIRRQRDMLGISDDWWASAEGRHVSRRRVRVLCGWLVAVCAIALWAAAVG